MAPSFQAMVRRGGGKYFLTDRDELILLNTQKEQGGDYTCAPEDGQDSMTFTIKAVPSKTLAPFDKGALIGVFVTCGIFIITGFICGTFVKIYNGRIRSSGGGYKSIPEEKDKCVEDSISRNSSCRSHDRDHTKYRDIIRDSNLEDASSSFEINRPRATESTALTGNEWTGEESQSHVSPGISAHGVFFIKDLVKKMKMMEEPKPMLQSFVESNFEDSGDFEESIRKSVEI